MNKNSLVFSGERITVKRNAYFHIDVKTKFGVKNIRYKWAKNSDKTQQLKNRFKNNSEFYIY